MILDEIGRGTSTYDGLSLAWSIVEHIHEQIGCRTLFATHYHELTDLEEQLTGVRNYNVAVKEWQDEVVFLHQIVPGAADKSYGIHVAQLAGVPRSVNERAREVLAWLEAQHETNVDQSELPSANGRVGRPANGSAEPLATHALRRRRSPALGRNPAPPISTSSRRSKRCGCSTAGSSDSPRNVQRRRLNARVGETCSIAVRWAIRVGASPATR